ncbi:hypothetical protein SAMN05421823_11296 [Catalinimonas alkaloidigena]|uniref:Short-chain dehydrogenase n=1 Tax=Catalinimonas alkaloidigena TaxID=1075417 RepID=A0A1G9SAZ6_9BACT|nr:SDR family NAD(P)-dependent oxidoreductase [Catalinimonas alkaloidigena]SDM32656.1 hypothetical protein SAMN05421823_11296 [Catalinimonas alkaloidigena]
MNSFALITGASHGIGLAMAHECARRGLHLLLVALPGSELEDATAELRAAFPHLTVHGFGIDLTEPDAPSRVLAWYRSLDVPLQVLINNAGTGTGGRFERIDWKRYENIMRLNNQALVGMCYQFLPELQTQSEAYLLNMSSLEAFLPLPYKAVYAGSKNFVYGFTLALREELKTSSVSATVICPGSVLTNEEGLERIKAHGAHARIMVMMPDEVARIAIRGLFKKRSVIVPGLLNRSFARLGRVMPTSTKMRILERLFRVYQEH